MFLSLSNCALGRFLGPDLSRLDALKAIREVGFKYTDYDIDEFLLSDADKYAALSREWLDEAGLTPAQAHAPCLNVFTEQGREKQHQLTQSIEFCGKAGIPAVVIHANATPGASREEFIERNREFYRSFIPAAEANNVKVLIENIGHPDDQFYLKNGRELRAMIDAVDHPLFLACWDVGHANHHPDSQYESIIALGEKLFALHVHDNCGYFPPCFRQHRIDMHTMPYASLYTDVNFDEVLFGLKEIGYKGTYNFEVITGNPRIRYTPFEHDGTVYDRLSRPSVEVWKAFNRALYETGRYQLAQYGMCEE